MIEHPAAVQIAADGTITALADCSYETIRDGVRGLIEAVPTDETITLWVNEAGKLNGLPFNPLGQTFWRQVDAYGCIRAGDWLAGPCVITGPPDEHGDTTPLPDWVLPRLTGLALTTVVIELRADCDG